MVGVRKQCQHMHSTGAYRCFKASTVSTALPANSFLFLRGLPAWIACVVCLRDQRDGPINPAAVGSIVWRN